MKLIASAVFLLSFTTGVFAQEMNAGLASSTITLYPTYSISKFFGGTTYSIGHVTATSSLKLYGSISSVEEKGANAKHELREEGTEVIDLLSLGEEVQLRKFKTLSAMITELKQDEVSRLEIEAAAEKNQVSFEVMAIKAIMLATEV